MKFAIILACIVSVAYGDLICFIGGNYACKLNCMASGLLHGGKCHADGDCKCITEEGSEVEPKPKTEFLCLLGGDLACEINCLTSVGHFLGHCNENKDCICKGRPTEPESRADLACKYGEPTCKAMCKYTGKGSGHCNENEDCVCEN